MTPRDQRYFGELAGAVASVLVFLTAYLICVIEFGWALTLALGWLPAAAAAILGAHAVRFFFDLLTSPRRSLQ